MENGQNRMSESEFKDILISKGQTRLSDELSALAQEKDSGRFDTLFFDYTELRMREFELRIMANMNHERIIRINQRIDKLDRLDIDLQQELLEERNRMQDELSDYDDKLESIVGDIEIMEGENRFKQDFLDFKNMIETKEGQLLEQINGPVDPSLN